MIPIINNLTTLRLDYLLNIIIVVFAIYFTYSLHQNTAIPEYVFYLFYIVATAAVVYNIYKLYQNSSVEQMIVRDDVADIYYNVKRNN